ncbi:hypothetical protein ACFQE0_16780 [Methylobacterium komagatae]|uniref:LysR substrate-binding domain-containing protein n=1 Tax=Methylobacterium komagatae TaxID=374425 RepID=A0ABW2BL36_9HYPH
MISAAVQGLGVALETLRFAEEEIASGTLVRLGEGQCEGIRRDLHFLCWRARDDEAPSIRHFREWILAEEGPAEPSGDVGMAALQPIG